MQEYIGKKVLIRANGAGVYFGTLEKMEGNQVKVANVRNIWRWTGASCLSQIANEGPSRPDRDHPQHRALQAAQRPDGQLRVWAQAVLRAALHQPRRRDDHVPIHGADRRRLRWRCHTAIS